MNPAQAQHGAQAVPALARLCILSDTHGQIDPRILSLARTCDHIIHAGDIGNAGVIQALESGGGLLTVIRGNNDVAAKWPPTETEVLSSLPDDADLGLPGGRLVVVHGHRVNPAARRHARLRQRYPGARAVVYGHSHRLCIDQQDRPWVLNPGAAGRSRTHGGPSCLVLHIARGAWTVQAHRFPLAAK